MTGFGTAQGGVTAFGHARDQTDGLVERVFAQDVADRQVRLDEQFVVDPVEAPGSEPPGRQETADAAVGDGGHEATLAEEQQRGQHPLPKEAADIVCGKLGLDEDASHLLQSVPLRGSFPSGVPTDPTMYRFYEMLQVYGSTLKALVHEQFGDGIISAINFKLDIKKVEDPDGGSRAVITLDGKYLPTKPF